VNDKAQPVNTFILLFLVMCLHHISIYISMSTVLAIKSLIHGTKLHSAYTKSNTIKLFRGNKGYSAIIKSTPLYKLLSISYTISRRIILRNNAEISTVDIYITNIQHN